MGIKHYFMSYAKFVIFHLCFRILTTLSHLCIIHQSRWQIVFYIYPLGIYKGHTGEAAETTNAPVNQTGWQRTIFLVTKRLKAKNLCLILLNLAGQKVLKLFLTPFLCFVNRPEYFLACKGYQKAAYWTSRTLAIYAFNGQLPAGMVLVWLHAILKERGYMEEGGANILLRRKKKKNLPRWQRAQGSQSSVDHTKFTQIGMIQQESGISACFVFKVFGDPFRDPQPLKWGEAACRLYKHEV